MVPVMKKSPAVLMEWATSKTIDLPFQSDTAVKMPSGTSGP